MANARNVAKLELLSLGEFYGDRAHKKSTAHKVKSTGDVGRRRDSFFRAASEFYF